MYRNTKFYRRFIWSKVLYCSETWTPRKLKPEAFGGLGNVTMEGNSEDKMAREVTTK
jgi:hypothetical protein